MRNNEGAPIYFEYEGEGGSGNSPSYQPISDRKVENPNADPLHFNPAAEPDLARLTAFLIPGVVNGIVSTQLRDGNIYEINFDERDQRGLPITRVYTRETPTIPTSHDSTIK